MSSVLRKQLTADANHTIHILLPAEMSDEVEVVVFTRSSSKLAAQEESLALARLMDENDDVRLAFITKTPVDEAQGFALETTDFADEPLKYRSYIRIDKTFNLNISLIEKTVAKLSDKGYECVLRRLVTLDFPALAALKYRIKPFLGGTTVIPPSGKVLDAEELKNMIEASLDGWLTTGRFNAEEDQGHHVGPLAGQSF